MVQVSATGLLAARIGDLLHSQRTLESLHASSHSLRASKSAGSLHTLASRQSRRANDWRYRGKAQSVTGGAPLSRAVQHNLHALQIKQLQSQLQNISQLESQLNSDPSAREIKLYQEMARQQGRAGARAAAR